ncbi:uncharacterized protein CMU_004820 [Cryptosporidium muris RN66]|uniref:Uncharacterized protein n=1 Tax=Cryptosporidium muris (strain RN66) TaxID=441375 RepID=B6AK83_CRYMR|nr:uncharacterized protein CMU_004820 [Cryptosporidium muris RN66]EEA08624.1 hypothetical protein CMU_004820 [Cryptosporidium muris RN66]|eukprot:XP_002142973.1 hypothetical protein [Cryptosporidium muris RN66]
MKVIFYCLLVLFFYFLYSTNLDKISIDIQRNSLLKLTAANQNPGADDDPILQCQQTLEQLQSQLSTVSTLIQANLEKWESLCNPPQSPLMEEICKILLDILTDLFNQEESLKNEISQKEAELENLQSANN